MQLLGPGEAAYFIHSASDAAAAAANGSFD